MTYCWSCRAKLPTDESVTARKEAINRGTRHVMILVGFFGTVAATILWALQ